MQRDDCVLKKGLFLSTDDERAVLYEDIVGVKPDVFPIEFQSALRSAGQRSRRA